MATEHTVRTATFDVLRRLGLTTQRHHVLEDVGDEDDADLAVAQHDGKLAQRVINYQTFIVI